MLIESPEFIHGEDVNDHNGHLFSDRILGVLSGNPVAFSSSEIYDDILESYVIPNNYEAHTFVQETKNRDFSFSLFMNLMDFAYVVSDKIRESDVDVAIMTMNSLMSMFRDRNMNMRSLILASGPALKDLVYACEENIQANAFPNACQYFGRDYLDLAIRLNMHEKLPEYLSRFEDMIFD